MKHLFGQLDNFDKICEYSLSLISQKKQAIEDCEEQYILSKIRTARKLLLIFVCDFCTNLIV